MRISVCDVLSTVACHWWIKHMTCRRIISLLAEFITMMLRDWLIPVHSSSFITTCRYRHDRSRYRVQCNLCNRILEKAKANSYASIILENSEDPKKLWKSINNILHRFSAQFLLENLSLKTICEKFSHFFVDKITIIRSKFPDDNELRNVHPSFYFLLFQSLTPNYFYHIPTFSWLTNLRSVAFYRNFLLFPLEKLRSILTFLIEIRES